VVVRQVRCGRGGKRQLENETAARHNFSVHLPYRCIWPIAGAMRPGIRSSCLSALGKCFETFRGIARRFARVDGRASHFYIPGYFVAFA
jgi:hypothetical protein